MSKDHGGPMTTAMTMRATWRSCSMPIMPIKARPCPLCREPAGTHRGACPNACDDYQPPDAAAVAEAALDALIALELDREYREAEVAPGWKADGIAQDYFMERQR